MCLGPVDSFRGVHKPRGDAHCENRDDEIKIHIVVGDWGVEGTSIYVKCVCGVGEYIQEKDKD